MRPVVYGFAVLMAGLTGLLLGALLPLDDSSTTEASGHRYTQWTFNPPTGGDANYDGAIWDYISCGWHTDCSYVNWGRAIDFHRNGAEGQIDDVIFRAFTAIINPDNPGLQIVGNEYSYEGDGTESCYTTYTRLNDINGSDQGYLKHTHTYNASWQTINVWGQPGQWHWNGHYIAKMVPWRNEKPGCPITGDHVHETVAWDVPFTHRDDDCNPPNYYPCYDVPDNQYRYDAVNQGSWHRWIDWNY